MNRQTLQRTTLAISMILAAGAAMAQTNVAELTRLSREFQAQSFAEKATAEMTARRLGLPVKVNLPDGGEAELMRFEHGQPRYFRTSNLIAAHTVNTSKLWPGGSTGLNLSGAGIKLAIWDGGSVRATHQEYSGRATVRDGAGISSHATHVGGTMIGAGIDPNAKGGSFQATLDSWDWNSDTSEMAAQAAAGITISNHSYGLITGWTSGDFGAGSGWYWFGDPAIHATKDYRFGLYDSEARAWDVVCNNAQYYLPCKAAGNDRNEGPGSQPTGFFWNGSTWAANGVARDRDGAPSGYDCLNGSGTAKNVLTVAAVNDIPGGWTSAASVSMSSFSSWGPTDDGRIKPDISANGVGLYSSYSNADNGYASLSGTSMATPNTTGSLGLLQQLWKQTNPNFMRSATLRGLVIHTANEAGSSLGPDYVFGHGLLNTAGAAQVIKDFALDGQSILETTLINATPQSYNYFSAGTGPLKVSICWNDPAGTTAPDANDVRTIKLVRDLDVRVTGPSGTFMPWTLDPNNPAAAAVQADNIRDNVEVISIPAPAAGNYTVSVTHKGTLSTPQPYTLIVTGWSNQPAALQSLTLAPNVIRGSLTSVGTVKLDKPAPFGGANVSLSSNNGAATVPPTVNIPFGASQANFNVTTTSVATIQTVTITSTYNSVSKTASLEVQPPLITGLTLSPAAVTGGTSSTATVTFDVATPVGGMTVNASSGNPAVATVPASFVTPGGVTSATFTVSTVAVASTQTALITATKDGTPASATLTVNPAAAGFVPTSMVPVGVSTLGPIDSVWTSNNVRLQVEPLGGNNKAMSLDFIGTGAANLTSLSLTFEGYAPNIALDVSAFNYTANTWVLLGTITATSDSTQTWSLSPATNFVGPGNAIKARVVPRPSGRASPFWQAFIDRLSWTGS
jgi:subtilisin family serine protease